jgi:divalent metal cation (Fe/Co/Zn/Cd) transporter
VVRSHEIAHAVKDKVRAKIPNVHDVLVHIEPGGHATGSYPHETLQPTRKPGDGI